MITKSLPGPVVRARYNNGPGYPDAVVTKVEGDLVHYDINSYKGTADVTDFIFRNKLAGLPSWLKAGARVYQKGVNEVFYRIIVVAETKRLVYRVSGSSEYVLGDIAGLLDGLSTGELYHIPEPVTKWYADTTDGVVREVYAKYPAEIGGLEHWIPVTPTPLNTEYLVARQHLCNTKNQATDELVRRLTEKHDAQVARLRSERDT